MDHFNMALCVVQIVVVAAYLLATAKTIKLNQSLMIIHQSYEKQRRESNG